MDYYPQPRPVIYCNCEEEESSPPTQTWPVRSGPPRYPPAPPLAGDAPDPYDGSGSGRSGTIAGPRAPGLQLIISLLVLYVATSAFSLVQVFFGADPLLLLIEVGFAVVVVWSLLWLGGQTYALAVQLLGLHVVLGLLFWQVLSPAWWVALAMLIYLFRPSIREFFRRTTEFESYMRFEARRRRIDLRLSKSKMRRVRHQSDWRRYYN